MKKIVTIGGGSGQPELLVGLREHDVELTAVVTMMDNGGSSGVLRKERGVLPPGDVRKCMVALAQDRHALGRTWNARDPQGHAAGNFVILDAVEKHGSWEAAIEALSAEHHLQGRVLPVTTQNANLVATLENGQAVHGEEAIDVPAHDATLSIQELALDHPVQATPAVLEAITQANCIVLAMGDLYTSVIPNLLVTGVTDAIARSQAKVVYVCNRSSKSGETHGFSSKDYVDILNRYLAPAKLTHVIVDNETVGHPDPALQVHAEDMPGLEVISTDLADEDSPLYVSGKKAANAIQRLCTS